MTRLVLVRHGQTDFNAAARFHGQLDIALNAVGQRQARQLQARLAGMRFAAVYSSDLQRALATAQTIVQDRPDGLEVQSLAALRETGFGRCEGLTFAEIERDYPDELARWQADNYNYALPGGETLRDMTSRVMTAVQNVLATYPGSDDSVLIVAHGGTLRVVLAELMGTSHRQLWQWRIDTGSVSLLDVYPAGPILSLLNDTHHLV